MSDSEYEESGSEYDSESDIDDFDPYSNEKIDMNMELMLQNSRFPCISQRDAFFNNSRFIVEEKGSPRTNIVDQVAHTCYCIPDGKIGEAMRLLDDCRKKQVISGFSERQREHSGILIDLDLLTPTERSYIENTMYQRMASYLIQMLQKFLKFKYKSEERVFVVFLRKPNVKYCTKKKEYKDGLHILIPGVQVTKEFKRYFIDQLISDGGIKQIFKKTKYSNLDDFIDPNSPNVFPLLLGNCKTDSSATYGIEDAFEVIVYKENPTAINKTTELKQCENLLYELSLNWECPTGLIKKRKFKLRNENSINTWNERNKGGNTEELTVTENNLKTLCVQDADARYYKSLLEIIDVEKAIDRNMWWKVINILSRMGNERYRILAYYFSQRCPEKYSKGAVNNVWEDSAGKHYELNIRIIERWAKEDSPKKFDEVKRSSAFETLQKASFEYEGTICETVVADILLSLLRGKYVSGIGDAKNSVFEWYEFITPADKGKKGEIYKYKYSRCPVSMNNYISHGLPILYNRMIKFVKDRMDKAADPVLLKYFIKLEKNLRASKINLTRENFRNNVMRSASTIFYDAEILDNMDSDGNLMGVGNGVLLLGSKCVLMDHYHEHFVSRFTPTNFRPFNPKETWCDRIHGAFRSIIPELDAFEKIMYYLCLGLDGNTKDSLFLFLVGNGANGKSFMLEMVSNAIGEKYAKKMPIEFIIGGRGNAQGPNPALMELKIARMVYYSEPNAAAELNVGKLKEMLGQEKMSGRTHHSEQENFRPACIHVSASNYDYEIKCHDFGTWRRIMYYRCKIKYCANPDPENPYEQKEDPELGKTVTRNPYALEATLSILVYYYEKLQAKYNGHIKDVQSITIENETLDFQNRQDTINEFICQMVVKVVDTKKADEVILTISQLADIYDLWYQSNKSKGVLHRNQLIDELKNSRLSKHIEMRPGTGVFTLRGHIVKEEPGDKIPVGTESYSIQGRKVNKFSKKNRRRVKRMIKKQIRRGKHGYVPQNEDGATFIENSDSESDSDNYSYSYSDSDSESEKVESEEDNVGWKKKKYSYMKKGASKVKSEKKKKKNVKDKARMYDLMKLIIDAEVKPLNAKEFNRELVY